MYGMVPPPEQAFGMPPLSVPSPYAMGPYPSMMPHPPSSEVPHVGVVAQPPPAEDHPDLYIAEEVKLFIPYFHKNIKDKNIPEILNIYENEFKRLSDRYFKEFPWPEAERIAPLVNNDRSFLVLFEELRYRHIYAKHKPTIDHRFESFYQYCTFFDVILSEC
jgi:translation initiation factor 3 subunit L